MRRTTWIAISVILLLGGATIAQGQSQIKISGLFYMDYEYLIASPDSGAAGENGFRYRRLYLTTDYKISDKFSGRARLEAQTSRLSGGKPIAFVKDLWLKWKGALGEGHDLIFGVQSPPAFATSEKLWGYRSVARTIMDRNAIVFSRDFGIQLKGKFGKDSPIGYAVMFANNSVVIGETDKSKRLYGQLSWTPSKKITLTGGADYAAGPDRNAIETNAFAAYNAGVVRVGIEGYYRSAEVKDVDKKDTNLGISVWAVAKASEKFELVGRVDRVVRESLRDIPDETFVLVGVAFVPDKNVRFIPNLWISEFTGSDPDVLGRLTIHADF